MLGSCSARTSADGGGFGGRGGSGYEREDPRGERGRDGYGGGGGQYGGGARGGGYDRDSRGGGGRPGGGGARQAANEREQREKDAAPREQGFVKTLKESYGFVQSADSDVQLFFHYSELPRGVDEQSLRPGDELEYGVYSSRDKPMAVKLNVLEPGTIKLFLTIATDVGGMVAKEQRETQSRGFDRNRREQVMGKIKLLPEQVGDEGVKLPEIVSYGIEDVADAEGEEKEKYKPGEGDEVKFDIIMVRATRQRKAANLRLVKAAEKPVVPREQGVVDALKDNFGFIKCADRSERLFFHFSEVKDKSQSLRNGDELEFVVSTDREKRNVANDIKILPKGTVTFITVLEEGVKGNVVREMRSTGGKRSAGGFGRDAAAHLYGGLVMLGDEKLPFDGEDLDDVKGHMPLIGDEVEFKLCMDKPTKKRKAMAVKVCAFAKAGREQGVVTKVKEGVQYAFIRCCDREEAVFFHFSEVEGQTAANGDELEFGVSEGKAEGRLTANRITKLPPGTVSFETVLEGRFEGTVERVLAEHSAASTKKGGKDHAIIGMIKEDVAEGDEDASQDVDRASKLRDPDLKLISYASSDLENLALVLSKGDRVSFTAVLDRPTKKKRATKVALVSPCLADGETGEETEIGPETGVISHIKNHHGYIRCAERDTRLYFMLSDVDPESLAAARGKESSNSVHDSVAQEESRGGQADADADVDADAGVTAPGEAEDSRGSAADAKGHKEHEDGASGDAKQEKHRKPRVGDELEFTILSHAKTRIMKAVKAKVLPKGTVCFEKELEGRFKGTVERELTYKAGGGRDHHAAVGSGGQVKLVEGETTTSLSFSGADMEKPLSQVKHGETIEFSILVDKASGDRRASKVSVAQSEGYVETVKDGYGFIKADADDGPYAKLTYFSMQDVEKGDQGKIEKGDSVAFFLMYNVSKKEIGAVRYSPCHEMIERTTNVFVHACMPWTMGLLLCT